MGNQENILHQSIRPCSQTACLSALPELPGECGQSDRFAEHLLPEYCRCQMYGIVSPKPMFPGKICSASDKNIGYLNTYEALPLRIEGLQGGLGLYSSQSLHPDCLCKGRRDLCPADRRGSNRRGLRYKTVYTIGIRFGDIPFDQRACVKIHDHSRSSINKSATERLPCVFGACGAALSRLLFHDKRPAFSIISIFCSVDAIIGTICPIG